MSRSLSFCFGLAAYSVFLVVFLCATGFVGGTIVPKAINSGTAISRRSKP